MINTNEMLALYDIISISYPVSYDEFMNELTEKTSRLFGTHYLALLLGEKGEKCLGRWGFENLIEVHKKINNPPSNAFLYKMKEENPGFLYMEQEKNLSEDDKRLYTILARRIEDLVGHKEATNKLEESEELNKSIVKAIPDILMRVFKDGTIINAWVKGKEMKNIGSKRIQGRSLTDIMPKINADRAMASLKITLTTERITIFQHPITLFRKSTRFFETRFVKRNENEVIAFARNITKEKKETDDLQKRREKTIVLQALQLELAKLNVDNYNYVLETVTQKVAETLQVDRVSIWLYDKTKTKIVCKKLYLLDKKKHFQGSEFLVSDTPLYFKSLDTNITVSVKNALENPATKELAKNYLIPSGVTSLLDVPIRLSGEVVGVFSLESTSKTRNWAEEEENFVSSVADTVSLATQRKSAQERLEISMNKNKTAMQGIIQAMEKTIEIRDPYTAGHQRRVSMLSVAIAEEMNLPQDKIEGIKLAALIHDIGKITVPADILSKPGKINIVEYNLIKIHPESGYDILKNIEFPWPIAKIIAQHHEKIDGSGYPYGLRGEEIMIEAQIIAVADVVEAMSSHRPYRPALGIEPALEEIIKNKGLLYNEEVATICTELFWQDKFHFA